MFPAEALKERDDKHLLEKMGVVEPQLCGMGAPQSMYTSALAAAWRV